MLRRTKLALLTIFLILFSAAVASSDSVPGSLAATMELVPIDGVFVPFQSGAPVIDFHPQKGHKLLDLSGTWKKQRTDLKQILSFAKRDDEGIANLEFEADGRTDVDYDDSDWEDKLLPAVEAEMPGDENKPPAAYHGGVWYRKTVAVPAELAGRRNRLVCLGANYIFDLWINGRWVGLHEGGYTPFALDVSDFLDYGADNQVTIRIHKPFPGKRQDAVPSWFLMDWWSYTGVIQDIYIVSAPAINIVRTDLIPTSYNGDLDVRVVVENATDADTQCAVTLMPFLADPQSPGYFTDPDAASIIGQQAAFEGPQTKGKVIGAGRTAVFRFPIRIKSPMRWTPKEPNLYVMKSTLFADGEPADENHSQFGIRTVDRQDGRLLVNGRVAFLPGVARHEEWPDTGRNASWDRILDDLDIIQQLNALFLRSGHYPCHIYTYTLTDRMGIAAMVELPVYWSMGWNWNHQAVRRISDQMFREMVFSNYNRPSILFWGTNNEPFFPFFTGLTNFNQRIADDFHNHFDDGRLVTQSLAAGNSWPLVATSQAPLDIAGWTLYYGVFYGDDVYNDTMQFLADHQSNYPDYPIIATEYGIWSGSDDSEAEDQLEVFNETWQAFAEAGALDAQGNINEDGTMAATSWWCAFNWFTKNGLPNFIAPYLQSMGLIHMDRTTWKPAATALADAYAPYFDFGGLGPEPDDYITTDDDDDDDDETPTDNDDDVSDDDSVLGNDDDDDGGGCCG